MDDHPLPTKSLFEKEISNPVAIRKLLLQCFHHGTHCLGGNELIAEDHTKASAKVLIQVWDAYPVELESPLVDVIWFAACATTEDEHKSKALIEIISSLVQKTHNESFWKQLQGTLDPSLLQSCGLLSPNDATNFTKKISKINTELFYKQQKYNLLQEETEGYAKLLTVLFGDLIDVTPNLLREYMGTFDLDPNRILDILLDLLESHDNKHQILLLMREFSIPKLPHLLTFKLSHYRTSGTSIPLSLIRTLIFLAQEEMLDLKTIVPVAVEDVRRCFALYERMMQLQISRLGRISLTNDNGNRPDSKLLECQQSFQAETAKLESQNVLVGLVHQLLLDQKWEIASTLLPSTEDWAQLLVVMQWKIGPELCTWVRTRISKVFETYVEGQKQIPSETMKENGLLHEDQNGRSESPEHVIESCYTALFALGQSGCLSKKPSLYSDLCSLVRAVLVSKRTGQVSPTIFNLLRFVFVPTLSLLPPDRRFAADLWNLLSVLPFSTRYQLYRDWRAGGLERAGMGSKPLLQILSEMEAGKAARYSLKRLSKDNITDMGRQVAEVTHSNPLVVFGTILSQIESYDNLIHMMVETIQFVTPLSLDVLAYCILTRLSGVGGVNRSRLKDDGVNVSQWLQSLEVFTGAFYRTCPEVECRGILSYLVYRLKTGHVLELGILKALIKSAGGYSFADYSPAASLSLSQLEGRAGSQLLKRETFAFGVVEDFDYHASNLVRSVMQCDDFAVTMLILLAQTRWRLLFHTGGTNKKHVKLVANLVDTCQVVMYILLEFITDSSMHCLAKDDGEQLREPPSSAIEVYAASLPPLDQLFDKHELDVVSSWMLCRPIFRAILGGKKCEHFQKHDKDRKQVVLRMLPQDVWNLISPDLFDTFFLFSLYDIHYPENAYNSQLTRLKDTEQRLALKKRNHNPSVHGMEFTMDDKLTLERTKESSHILAMDMEHQKNHWESIREHIAGKGNTMFPSSETSAAAMQAFITRCVYPRCKLNPDEASYCFRFVTTIHFLKTPGFSILQFIDEFVKVVAGSLYSSTENEAASFGVLLLELWTAVSRWRYEDGSFDEEVANTPGATMADANGVVTVSSGDYKGLYNKWHATIGMATVGCLDSMEYMHLRSCFVVLSRIVDVFPTRPKLGQTLLDCLEPLQDETYPLQDIRTAAQAYGTLLVKARSDGVWKEEDSATIKAREAKEKAENAAKLKRREELHADMKRDMEKMDLEAGETGRRDDRDSRRRGQPLDSRGVSKTEASRRPVFEPPPKQQLTLARSSRRETAMENGDRARRGATDSDRVTTRNDRSSDKSQQPEFLEGRWERGQKQSGPGKRIRSPAPDDDQLSSKRNRIEGRSNALSTNPINFEPPARSSQRGGAPLSSQSQTQPQQRSGRDGFSRRDTTRR